MNKGKSKYDRFTKEAMMASDNSISKRQEFLDIFISVYGRKPNLSSKISTNSKGLSGYMCDDLGSRINFTKNF